MLFAPSSLLSRETALRRFALEARRWFGWVVGWIGRRFLVVFHVDDHEFVRATIRDVRENVKDSEVLWRRSE